VHQVLARDGTIVFQGMPEQVESWLFENTMKYNAKLKVRTRTDSVMPALKYIGAK